MEDRQPGQDDPLGLRLGANAANARMAEADLLAVAIAKGCADALRPLVMSLYGLGMLMDADRLNRLGGKAKAAEDVAQMGANALLAAMQAAGVSVNVKRAEEEVRPDGEGTDAPQPNG